MKLHNSPISAGPEAIAGGRPCRPLGYRPRPRGLGRRARRLLALVVLAAVACSAAARWGRPAWRHAQVLYWQRQCMEYAPPPGTVVIETRAAEAERLLASGRGYVATRNDDPDAWYGRSVRPFCVATLEAPPGLIRLDPGFRGMGTAFLHRRRSPAAHVRLVVVTCSTRGGGTNGAYYSSIYAGSAAVPAGWIGGELRWTRTTLVSLGDVDPFFDVSTDPPTARPTFVLYAGQPDPADESHFTIAFQFHGSYDRDWRPGTIDGWLRDDDSVRLAVRDPAQYADTAIGGYEFGLTHSP